jgi:hypothetical protein
MTRRNDSDSELPVLLRGRAVATAHAVLNGSIGIVEGARTLSILSHDIVKDSRVDPDFDVFVGLDSETLDLPIGKDRDRWDQIALVEQDAKVREMEARWRSDVEIACRNLIRRFADV